MTESTEKERRYARGAYNWLRLSPLLTIPTLFIVYGMSLGWVVCDNLPFECSYDLIEFVSLGIGVIVSALWHLILLQYVNNTESEFVRGHGRRAFTHAGIRTGVALAAAFLSLLMGGFAITFGVLVLIILWATATSWKNLIPAESPPPSPADFRQADASNSGQRERTIETDESVLKRLHEALQSEDDVVVLGAIDKLEGIEDIPDEILKQAILKELEFLADEHDNMDVRMDARVTFNRLRGVVTLPNEVTNRTTGDEMSNAKETLDKVLGELKSGDDDVVLQAVETARGLEFSSEAVRRRLEALAAQSSSAEIRAAALAALNSPANRAVQKHANSNKLDRGIRYTILQEINEWAKSKLIETHTADVIRRRYDFDFTPQPFDAAQGKPAPSPAQLAVPMPEAVQPKPAPTETAPKAPAQSPAPVAPEPRASLLQTLTSEGAIKIYLYLGAFFVIAAAAILGAVVPTLRLPILIVGTLIFGGISVAIKRRLPQPSFALFIVFSFLLPITANSLMETLRGAYDLSSAFTSGYWAAVFLCMSAIWSGGTRLYESRFFSVAAFAALLISFLNLGDLFGPAPASNATAGLAALGGVAGTWLLKKWRDEKFAAPLFLSAQFVQAVNLFSSAALFINYIFDEPYRPIWFLAFFAAWGMASVFYILSNGLFPFFAFPWLAAGALVPAPWFIILAFQTETLPSALILFAWSALLAASSEVLRRTESQAKYYLPGLVASLPGFAFAVLAGFGHATWLGLALSLVIAALFALLHFLHSRWPLWTLALLNAIIAYFAFFELDVIQRLDIFDGYVLALLVFLLLLPDFILAKDWKLSLPTRLPIRIYAAFFTLFLSFGLPASDKSLHVAICYFIIVALFAVYALAYRKAWIGYLPAASLALAAVYFLDAFNVDAWLPVLSALAVLYFAAGFIIRSKNDWASMLRFSGLGLGVIVSFTALLLTERFGGWYTLVLGALFLAEMGIRKNGWFELGAPILFTSGAYLILNEFKVDEIYFHLLAYSLIWVFTDLLDRLTYRHPRNLSLFLQGVGGLLAGFNALLLMVADPRDAAICFGAYTLAYGVVAVIYRKVWLVYIPAATLPLTVFFALDHFKVDAWLPALTGLAVLYFLVGLAVRAKEGWPLAFRNSALILGSIVSIFALIQLKETGGWYALAIGLLFIAEMSLRKNGLFEPGAPTLFTMGVFLILHDFTVDRVTYHLLAYSLIWLIADLLAHLAFPNPRPLAWLVRAAGGLVALLNYFYLFGESDAGVAALGFGVYSLLFLTVSLLYRNPNLLYAFTLTLPLFAAFLFRAFELTRWMHPVIVVAALYYGVGYFLRKTQTAIGWESPLLNSGLGLGVFTSIAAAVIGGVDASIPVAVAATLWAVEAFAKRNAWLAFPANALYLLSYFIILFDLDVSEPQYYSIGAALFGLIQHYLLTRAESKTGAFVMGMFSQFVLLGTTYIELVGKSNLNYFFLLFAQSLVVLVYGIVIRSRSLTFFPIGFAALGVVTVVYSALKDVGTIFVIGCTGIVLLTLGVVAVLLRERIAKLGERLSEWKA